MYSTANAIRWWYSSVFSDPVKIFNKNATKDCFQDRSIAHDHNLIGFLCFFSCPIYLLHCSLAASTNRLQEMLQVVLLMLACVFAACCYHYYYNHFYYCHVMQASSSGIKSETRNRNDVYVRQGRCEPAATSGVVFSAPRRLFDISAAWPFGVRFSVLLSRSTHSPPLTPTQHSHTVVAAAASNAGNRWTSLCTTCFYILYCLRRIDGLGHSAAVELKLRTAQTVAAWRFR